MNKPNNYDSTSAGSERVAIDLGGHYAKILKVEEKKSKAGQDMIVVYFDFTYPDDQEGMFAATYKADQREEKKWPFAGTKYIMVNDYKDNSTTSKAFKSFCSNAEKSNKGFEIAWGDDWGTQFKDKNIGVVYGLEENEYNGKFFMRETPKWFCKFEEAKKAAVPDPKYLQVKDAPKMEEIKGSDDELPF